MSRSTWRHLLFPRYQDQVLREHPVASTGCWYRSPLFQPVCEALSDEAACRL